MASLVAPLASGIAGAASGSAAFFRAGTSTTATVYSDAEGVTAVTSHTLDANGGVERYVEGRVDVVVYDSNGATVRTFTWGTDAREARVENAYFTGPDATGAIVAGGRQTVDSVLTKLGLSLGATDGYVDINGTAFSLTDALSNSLVVFNVQKYGARGDGTTDDGPFIQLAWNAAASAGGGIVYYPSATGYLCTTAVTMPASVGKVWHLGDSATASKIKQANTTTMWTLGNGNQNLLLGLSFSPSSAANTGTLLSFGTTARATFVGCNFDPLDGTTFAMAAASTSRVNCSSCSIAQAGASSRLGTGAGARLRFESCDISTSGANLTSFDEAITVTSLGCSWDLGSATAAGTTVLYTAGTGTVEIIGGAVRTLFTSGAVTLCTAGTLHTSGAFFTSAGATVALAGSSATLYESACNFSGSGTASFPQADCGIGTPSDGMSTARMRSYSVSTGSAVALTPTAAHLLHEIESDGVAMAINNPSTTLPAGWPLIIVYRNKNVAAITPTFGTAYTLQGAAGAIAQNRCGVYYFIPRLAAVGGIVADLVCISSVAEFNVA